jgi:orotidine-5'-phosphate decarboxylase
MTNLVKDQKFLTSLIRERKTVLTVGLDTDTRKMPAVLHGDVLKFNTSIIDATRDICVAYKLNFAFYEAMGLKGWELLEKTVQYIGHHHLIIGDAKRGDIGNTSEMYATAVYDYLGCDAITVNPYMGADSVKPFLREGKWVILLAYTSNTGSRDFQQLILSDGRKLFEAVMQTTSTYGNASNTMYVVGATHPEELSQIRSAFPDHFLLIPGIGAQGGDLEAVLQAGLNHQGGLLINASRSIIYASQEADFAEKGRMEAERLNTIMGKYLGAVG